MVDDDVWAPPPEGDGFGPDAAPEADRPGAKRAPRARLPLLLGVLAVVVVAGLWIVAAKHGVNEFDRAFPGERSGACDGDLTIEDVRLAVDVPAELPDGLGQVATAFEAYFAQDRWSFTDVSEAGSAGDRSPEVTFSADGDLLERRMPDGFVGLIKPGAGIARFEGDRFWVPACVNGFPFEPFFFRDAECVEATTEGETTVVRWAIVRDQTCEDPLMRLRATLVDGDLTGWSLQALDRSPITWEVNEPRSLSWPSPFWIAPSWLAGD